MSIAQVARPFILCEAQVARVARLSPSFVRVWLSAPELRDFGVDGPTYDQRIKLVFADGDGPPPRFGDGEDWYAEWLTRPEAERGQMRTYTVRAIEGAGEATLVVVDLVTHGTDGHGEAGPGSRWAASAAVGSRVVLIGPRRGHLHGGIEFAPGEASRVLLAADETAVPAVVATLAQLAPTAVGAAFLEVPLSADVQSVVHPAGVKVVWLPRSGAEVGSLLRPAVLAYLGAHGAAADLAPDEVRDEVWETPTYSASGEAVDEHAVTVGHDLDGLYAWIAGESRVVTGLRRALVKDLGMDRRQVAFMGYWRRGVAMGA